MRPCFGAGRRSYAGDIGAVAPVAVGDIGAPPGDAGPGEATTTFPGGAATGDAGGGGVTVGGPPPGEVLGRSSAISRQPGDLGDAGSAGAGEVSSKFAWSPGLSPTGPTGEERCGAPAARESAREGIEGERARRGGECEVSDVGRDRHFPRPRKRHERDGNVEAGPSVRTRSAGFGAATHLLRRWPLRLSRAATCARAVSEWPRAKRRARFVATFQRFELQGGTTLDFFDRANSPQTSTILAVRNTRFVPFWRVSFSPTFEAFFAPSVKEPGAMASTENMPPLPEAIAALKDEGNGFFRAGDFLKAAGAYTKALKVRPVARPVSRFRITRLANRRSADARGASL